MILVAIDPGTTESAFVELMGDGSVREHGKLDNHQLLNRLGSIDADDLVIEMVASYGMPVGAEVFETVFWIGRFFEAWRPRQAHRIVRGKVKSHLCHSAKANDATIRQALIDRYGGKEAAVGRKAAPGPLYGIHGDEWQALALAVTWSDLRAQEAAE